MEGMPNLPLIFFAALLATVIIGCLFGCPLGMIVGTVVGYFKAKKIALAPDAEPEGQKPYLLGIVLPFAILIIVVPLYIRLNLLLLSWIF